MDAGTIEGRRQIEDICKKGVDFASALDFGAKTGLLLAKERAQRESRVFIKGLKSILDQVTRLEYIETRRGCIGNLTLNHKEHVLANVLDDFDEKTLVERRVSQLV